MAVDKAPTPSIILGRNELRLRSPEAFGSGGLGHARRFARRTLSIPEVRSLTIDPMRGEAVLSFQLLSEDPHAWLARLSELLSHDEAESGDDTLPEWSADRPIHLTRVGDAFTRLRLIESGPGFLRVDTDPDTSAARPTAPRVAELLSMLDGVSEARVEPGSDTVIAVRFDGAMLQPTAILRAIERTMAAATSRATTIVDTAPRTGLANATLGLGAVGELALPIATPLAAGVLVATKLGVMRDAMVQLGRGKVGVPLFDTALLACSIVTGQVLAYALTDWSLRYWQRRWRTQAGAAAQALFDETLTLPAVARRVEPNGKPLRLVAASDLEAGDRVQILAGERIPADGRVIEGSALVEELPESELGGAARKSIGDLVLAGSRVHAGEILLEVERVGPDTTAEAIETTLIGVLSGLPRADPLNRKSEELAERTVVPTLATAGVGWMAGDLITVGAILHQDWISGPGLAVPLTTLQQLREAYRSGVLIRNPAALQSLAEADFLVVDGDDPALTLPSLELADIRSRIADPDVVVRVAASAAQYLGDARASALAESCRQRGLIVRQSGLLAIEPDRVTVRIGEHVVRLTDGARSKAAAPELLMEVDDQEVAQLAFRSASEPRVAAAMRQLRADGWQTFLVSERSQQQADGLAARVGIELAGGSLNTAERIRFLEGLRRRGVRPVYIGRLAPHAEIVQSGAPTIDTGGFASIDTAADCVLLRASYEDLAKLLALSRAYEPEILSATRMATIPNLLCIAGAFAGLLNGITAGIIANVGVMNVDRKLRQSLSSGTRPARRASG